MTRSISRLLVPLVAAVCAGSACTPTTAPPSCPDGWAEVTRLTTTQVSSNNPTRGIAVSGNGRFVAIGGLVTAMSVYDRTAGALDAAPGDTAGDAFPVVSANGSIVAFRRSTVPFFSLPAEVVVWNRGVGTVTTIPRDGSPAGPTAPFGISADGRHVLVSRWSNDPLNSFDHSEVYDVLTGTTARIDLSATFPGSTTQGFSLSDDGDLVGVTVTHPTQLTVIGTYRRSTGGFTAAPASMRRIIGFSTTGKALGSGGFWDPSSGGFTSLPRTVVALAADGTRALVAGDAFGGPSGLVEIDITTGAERVVVDWYPDAGVFLAPGAVDDALRVVGNVEQAPEPGINGIVTISERCAA